MLQTVLRWCGKGGLEGRSGKGVRWLFQQDVLLESSSIRWSAGNGCWY